LVSIQNSKNLTHVKSTPYGAILDLRLALLEVINPIKSVIRVRNVSFRYTEIMIS